MLSLSQVTVRQKSIGHIVNIASNDVQRFDQVWLCFRSSHMTEFCFGSGIFVHPFYLGQHSACLPNHVPDLPRDRLGCFFLRCPCRHPGAIKHPASKTICKYQVSTISANNSVKYHTNILPLVMYFFWSIHYLKTFKCMIL